MDDATLTIEVAVEFRGELCCPSGEGIGAPSSALKRKTSAQHGAASPRSESNNVSDSPQNFGELRESADACESLQTVQVGGGGLEPSTSRV